MAFTVDIRGNASHLEKTLKSVKGSLTDLGGAGVKAATAGLVAMGAAGAAAIGAFVVTSSQAAASIEDLALQFEVLTGSAQASKDLLKAFREEEKKSALNTEDYAEAAKMLLTFGGSLEDTIPNLKMLADVSMGNSERFENLARAFAQTTAAGKLMGQEVLQFVNAGFNPLQQISLDTGKSMADLRKEMEDGKISVQMVKQAFINATSAGGRFYGAIDKGSATTSAKLNQTQAAVTQLQVAFGTGFNQGLKDALDAANKFLPQLEGRFTDAGTLLGAALTDAVTGDMSKFQLIGELVGTAIVSGFKIAFKKGVMDTIEDVFADYADYMESRRYAEETAKKQKIVDLAMKTDDPARRKQLLDAAQNMQIPEPTIRSNYEAGKAYQQKHEASQFANDMAPVLKKLQTQLDIQAALKERDLNPNMRTEVREGVLEAWKKNPNAGAARFSN